MFWVLEGLLGLLLRLADTNNGAAAGRHLSNNALLLSWVLRNWFLLVPIYGLGLMLHLLNLKILLYVEEVVKAFKALTRFVYNTLSWALNRSLRRLRESTVSGLTRLWSNRLLSKVDGVSSQLKHFLLLLIYQEVLIKLKWSSWCLINIWNVIFKLSITVVTNFNRLINESRIVHLHLKFGRGV